MIDAIRARRSVRTYDGRAVDEDVLLQLLAESALWGNPFGIPVSFRFLNAKEHGLVCPVVTGTELYVGGKIKKVPHACAAFGYSFEQFVLRAQEMGLGTVWLGGTMNRAAYEAAMDLAEDEMMPCASPLGYTAEKMSVREAMMRKAIRADERLPFEELFFNGDTASPLSAQQAGDLALPLEMVRLAPSAVNKQPWRVIVKDGAAHFYCKRSKGFGGGKLDMQMIDMGIALCHFDVTAKACGLDVEFAQENPGLAEDMKYVASYWVK